MSPSGSNTRKIKVVITQDKKRQVYPTTGNWIFWLDDLTSVSSLVNQFLSANPKVRRVIVHILYPSLPNKVGR